MSLEVKSYILSKKGSPSKEDLDEVGSNLFITRRVAVLCYDERVRRK